MSGNRQAALAIWPWQDPPAQRLAASRAALQRHGALRAGIGLLAAMCLFVLGHRHLATVVMSIATLTLLAALLSPQRVYASLQRALDRFGHGVGVVLTFLCLAPLYLLVITPFGLLFRHGARDPLHRAFAKDATTYWTPRAPNPDATARRQRPF